MPAAEVQTQGTDFGTARTVTLDAPPTVGNLLLAYSHHRSGAADASISGTGWTKVLERDIETGDTTFRRAEAVFAKFAGVSETDTIDIDWSGGVSSQMQVREFSGVEGDIGDLVFASNDNGATADELSLATGTTGAVTGDVLNVAFFGVKKNATNPINALDFDFGVGWAAEQVQEDTATQAMIIASSWIELTASGGQATTVSYTATDDANNGLHAAIISMPVAAGGADLTLSGTSQSESELAGSMDAQPGLAGSIASSGQMSGAMDARPGLAGTAQSESAASAALALLIDLAGTLTSESRHTGQAGLDIALGGTITSTSALTGALETVAQLLLSGTISSQSDLSASLHRALGLAGIATSESDASGLIGLLQSLRGTTTSVSAAVGALGLELALGGDVVSESHLSAALLESFTPGLLTIDAIRLVAALDGKPELLAKLSGTPAIRAAIDADAITINPRT